MATSLALAFKIKNEATGYVEAGQNNFSLLPASLTKLFTIAASFEHRPDSNSLQALRIRAGRFSDNAAANILMRSFGGLSVLRSFADSFDKDKVYLYDASGLCRGNRASVNSIFNLLQHVMRRPYFDRFTECLARPGESGTLKERLLGVRVAAKTGSLKCSAGLAGYGINKKNEPVSFCVLLNSSNPKEEIKVGMKCIEDEFIKQVLNG